MGRAHKYDPLASYLHEAGQDHIEMSFEDVERLVGPLPESAAKYRQWWENGGHHSQARAWLSAGYKVDDVNQERRRVRFTRA
jgi:hypothetical protein